MPAIRTTKLHFQVIVVLNDAVSPANRKYTRPMPAHPETDLDLCRPVPSADSEVFNNQGEAAEMGGWKSNLGGLLAGQSATVSTSETA